MLSLGNKLDSKTNRLKVKRWKKIYAGKQQLQEI